MARPSRAALIVLWEASARVCSKPPSIPALLPALERHGQLALADDIRDLLPGISPATRDRLLTEFRLTAQADAAPASGSAPLAGETSQAAMA